MKKRFVLIALAVVILLGCGIGAWIYFQQPEQTDSSGWVEVLRPDSGQPGALSDKGYYYLPYSGKNSIHYLDFATGKSAALCSRLGCDHDSKDCDAFIDRFQCKMFYYGDHLYYSNSSDPMLYRRDAIGLSLTEIGIPGKQFIEQQKSVSYGNYVPLDGWMYYEATVSSKDGGGAQITEMRYIGRLNLTTGKEEVLVEQAESSTLRLLAVRSGSILYAQWETGNLDSSAPDYSEKFRQRKVTLERYDLETDGTTVLFEKTRAECQEIHMVYDNKVYCAIYPTGGYTDTYIYDMETGEYSLQYENTMLRYLGGGYALYKVGPEGTYKLMNMVTGEDLPYSSEGSAPLPKMKSENGVVLYHIGAEQEDGTKTIRYCYAAYDALADGLQETDLLEVSSMQDTSLLPQNPATPTDPTEPELFEDVPWIPWNVYFTQCPQPPVENIEKKIQYLPESVDNPDNLPVLKWVFAMADMDRTWTENAVIELNRMLADRKMPFRVQFVILMSKNIGAPAYQMSGGGLIPYDVYALLASEEAQELLKDADLIFGNMTPEEMQTLLAPITQYVNGDTEHSLQNSVAHRLDWLTTTFDGEIYGIKQINPSDNNGYYGWIVSKKLMEKAGLTADDFRKNFWEMDEVLAKLYQANGNQPVMNTANFKNTGWYYNFRGKLGPCFPGVLEDVAKTMHNQLIGAIFAIDNSGEKPTVVNALETVRIAQEAILRYRDAGYLSEGGSGVGYHEIGFNSEPYYLEANGSIWIPVDMGGFETTYPTLRIIVEEGSQINGIAATSQHKEEAAMLLNLLAEDEAFRNQFLYGKEGRDYQVEDGHIVPIEGTDGACYTMADTFNGYELLSNQKALQNYRDKADKTEAVAYPVAFDYTGYEEELEQIGKILGVYYPVFFNNEEVEYSTSIAAGTVAKEPKMDEALYDRVLEMLSDAGADEIIAELQRQLDAWLAANPDWDK